MLEQWNLSYLCKFYRYILAKKRPEFFTFFIITFVLALLPYFLVWWEINSLPDDKQRSFYGDGSVIILCSGILCSYFGMLFDFKDDQEKRWNKVYNLVLVIIYILLLFVFYKCQLNFNRTWSFISTIVIISALTLILTLLAALFLNFKQHVIYAEVIKYDNELNAKKMEKQALKQSKSKSGINV